MNKEVGRVRIAVVGLGGVGGYYGGKLARHCLNREDREVIFIARGDHLKAIQKNGLQQITVEGTFTAIPHLATDDPTGVGVFDLVLFCVKAYDLEESAKMLKNNISEQTVAVTLLNGVDHAERLKELLPKARVLNGCVYIGAYRVSPGVVRQVGGSCKLFFGPEDGRCKEARWVEAVLREAGIQAEYREDIKTVVWEKYLFISPVANATTYLGKTFGELLRSEESMKLLDGLLDELERVARDQGVRLPQEIHRMSLERISSFPPETKSSMQLDFERGAKTELDALTGYVVRYARDHGMAVPTYGEVYEWLLRRGETRE